MQHFHLRRRPLVLLALLALVIGLIAFPAVAYADNGHGHGHGEGSENDQGDDEDYDEGGHNSDVFSDLGSDHWAWGYVSKMWAMGILAGYGDGRFMPQNNVTKLELVIMVTRIIGAEDAALALPAEEVQTLLANAFKDSKHLPNWAGARECLAYALKTGYLWPLLSGESDSFQCGTPATRTEVVVTLLEAMGLGDEARTHIGSTIAFKDAYAVPGWARGHIVLAIEMGILQGDGGNLKPNQPVTRAEMAALLSRAGMDIDTGESRGVVSGTVTAVHVATSASDTSTITIRAALFPGLFGMGSSSAGQQGGPSLGQTRTYELLPTAVVMVNDTPGDLADIVAGDRVALYLDENGKVLLVDVADEANPTPTTAAGTLTAWTVASGKLTSITIRPISTSSVAANPVTYNVAADATLKRDGQTVPVTELEVGLSLKLGLVGGVVKAVEIIGETNPQVDVVTGTLSEITVGNGTTVPSSVAIIPTGGHAADAEDYALAEGAVVIINDVAGSLGDARPGDAATAHLNSAGKIILLEVEFSVSEATGTVTGVVRGANGHVTTLTLVKDSQATTYAVTADASVTKDDVDVSDELVTVGDGVAVRIARGSIVAIDIVTDVP